MNDTNINALIQSNDVMFRDDCALIQPFDLATPLILYNLGYGTF